jgi:hypothetical protein
MALLGQFAPVYYRRWVCGLLSPATDMALERSRSAMLSEFGEGHSLIAVARPGPSLV